MNKDPELLSLVAFRAVHCQTVIRITYKNLYLPYTSLRIVLPEWPLLLLSTVNNYFQHFQMFFSHEFLNATIGTRGSRTVCQNAMCTACVLYKATKRTMLASMCVFLHSHGTNMNTHTYTHVLMTRENTSSTHILINRKATGRKKILVC